MINNENVFVAGQSGDHTKIIITKYDTNGNLIWERFYSIQDLGVVATWLSVDPTGNVIVTGYPRTFSSNPVETGLLTLKYDNNGNLLWDKLMSGTWAFTLRSIVDLDGNIYVTGRAWQYTATYDFVTVKYAPDGTQLSTFGDHAWDAFHLLVNAMRAAGTDRAKVRDALETTRGFVGTAGLFDLSATDHNGLGLDSSEMLVVKDGAFAVLSN